MVVVEREEPTCSRKKKKIPSLCRPVNRPIQRGCLHMGERTRHDVRVGLVEVEIVLVWTRWKAGRAQAEERLGLRGSKLDLVGERLKVMDWAIGPARERGGRRAREGGSLRSSEISSSAVPQSFRIARSATRKLMLVLLRRRVPSKNLRNRARCSQRRTRCLAQRPSSSRLSTSPSFLLLFSSTHDVVLQPKFRTFSTPTPTARPLRSFRSTATLLSSA